MADNTPRLSIPSVLGLELGSLPPGLTILLQAMQTGMNTLDRDVLYRDTVDVVIPTPQLRAVAATGQSFSISGTNVASGDDYQVLVANFRAHLNDFAALSQAVTALEKAVSGRS